MFGGPAIDAMMPWALIVVPCGMDAMRETVSWAIGRHGGGGHMDPNSGLDVDADFFAVDGDVV